MGEDLEKFVEKYPTYIEALEQIDKLKQRITGLEEEVKKYKKLLADKTKQFDSVRQRYHLLNRLQADYDKKDKLHLSEMQCLELVEQNEKLQEENELKNHTIEFLESQRDNAYKEYRELKKTIKQTQLDWVQADKSLELAKNYVKDLQKENTKLKEQLKNAIIIPENFDIGQKVFMIPTSNNCLKKIMAYNILRFSKSGIGLRADLSIVKKEKDVEPYFSADFDEFNKTIFATEDEAQKYLEEHRND